MNIDFSLKNTEFATYTVLNNDTVTGFFPDEGDVVLKIIDKIEEKNYVIFEILNGSCNKYFIPYKFRDNSKNPVFSKKVNIMIIINFI